jgi:hypothetical protein
MTMTTTAPAAIRTEPVMPTLDQDVHEVARQALAWVVRDRAVADDVMASVLAEIGLPRLGNRDDLRVFGEQLARREASLHALGLLLVAKSAALATLDA